MSLNVYAHQRYVCDSCDKPAILVPTCRQTDRQPGRQGGRQAGRQTDRHPTTFAVGLEINFASGAEDERVAGSHFAKKELIPRFHRLVLRVLHTSLQLM